MATATTRIGDVVALQRRQEHFVEMGSAAIVQKQSAERMVSEKHGHEEWAQGIEQAWQDTWKAYSSACANFSSKINN
jgi:hypothetical protein